MILTVVRDCRRVVSVLHLGNFLQSEGIQQFFVVINENYEFIWKIESFPPDRTVTHKNRTRIKNKCNQLHDENVSGANSTEKVCSHLQQRYLLNLL